MFKVLKKSECWSGVSSNDLQLPLLRGKVLKKELYFIICGNKYYCISNQEDVYLKINLFKKCFLSVFLFHENLHFYFPFSFFFSFIPLFTIKEDKNRRYLKFIMIQ